MLQIKNPPKRRAFCYFLKGLSLLPSGFKMLASFAAITFRAAHAVHSATETKGAKSLVFLKEAA